MLSSPGDRSYYGACARIMNGIPNRTTKRLGLIYDPPTLSVEYTIFCSETNEEINRHKKIYLRVKQVTIGFDPKVIAIALVKRYPYLFDNVSFRQLLRFITKLLKSSFNHRSESAIDDTQNLYNFKEKALSDDERKNMESESNKICALNRPEILKDMNISLVKSASPLASIILNENNKTVSEMAKYRLHTIGNLDLNKVSEQDLKKAKDEMDHVFLENRVEPSDEGYEFDKQVSFVDQDLDSSWD